MEDRPGKRHREEIDDDEPKNSLNNKQPLIIIAVSVALSLLAVFVWANSNLVMRTPYEEDITGIVDDMATVKQEVSVSTSAVDNAVANLSNTVTAQVNNSLTQVTNRLNNIETNTNSAKELATNTNAQVGTISGDVGTLKASLTEATAKITALQTQLTASTARVTALEAKLKDDTEDVLVHEAMSVSATITSDGFPTGSDNKSVVGIKIILTNKTDRDLEDIVLQVPIDVYTDTGENIIARSISGTGWSVREWGSDYVEIRGRGISLDKKDTDKIRLSLTLTFSGEVDDGEVDIDEEDIEVIEWDYE